MNHVNLIGKMTSEPRYYELPNGRKVAHFTLTTKETILDEDGKPKDKKDWHRISAWGNWVKILEEMGQIEIELAIEGKLKTRFFGKNGTKQSISEVEINDLIIL